MVYISEGEGEPVNEAGKEQPLKAGDFTPLNPDAKHQYQKKGDKPFKMICRCRRIRNEESYEVENHL